MPNVTTSIRALARRDRGAASLVRSVSAMGVAAALLSTPFAGASVGSLYAQTDLDAFMQQVLVRRDDNWRKLQQYVLDEREEIEIRGPTRAPIWGERRDYTWYVRDGYFVRSPVKVNGVTIGEGDRREYEESYLRRVKRRDARQAAPDGAPDPPSDAEQPPGDVDGLIRQTRQPQFISSAYFLRFRFEEGHYALVGREPLDGLDTLRVEYYPSKLFANRRDRTPDAYDAEIQRLMNKSSLVTLWIEPSSHQIVKYTFDNLGLDFLPIHWLVRVNEVTASMTMGQPFPDVWLPAGLEVRAGMTMALGAIDFRYSLGYADYRRADVRSTLIVPEP
jgi:hypothetical protein